MANTKGVQAELFSKPTSQDDYIKGISEKAERRYFSLPINFLEIEENGAKTPDENQITGYAAVFEKDSECFGTFVERIARGAFDDVLNDDTWAYLNHSINHPLGRNKINLKLEVDDVGLRYTVKLPNTTDGQNVRELVKSKIMYKSSFAFMAAEETFTKGDPAAGIMHVRTITKMERLFDVSPLSTDPAYPDTSVAQRSLKRETAKEEIKISLRSMQEITYIIQKTKFNSKHLNKR